MKKYFLFVSLQAIFCVWALICPYFSISYFLEKNHAFLLLASYPLFLYEWIKQSTSQYLSQSKIPSSDLYSNWLKKKPRPEVDIFYENNLDTNSKIQLDNWKKRQNSKIAFEFQNSIKKKIKIRDLISIFWKIENRWRDLFYKRNLGDLTDQISIRAKKNLQRKWIQNSFFIFYWKWKFKFEFPFPNW